MLSSRPRRAQKTAPEKTGARAFTQRGDTGEPIFASEPLSGLRHFQTLIATRDHLYVGADERIYAFSF
jgi:hypothetical protein